MRSKGIRILPADAEEARKSLAALGLLNRELRIATEGEHVLLPVTDYPGARFVGERCMADFQERGARGGYRESAVIPAGLKRYLPSSFDVVGTKAILKLPGELVGYEKNIGEAILNSNKSLDSVFIDSGVSGPYRTRTVRAVAGRGGTETEITEFGIRLKLDVSKTFYSPRLASERMRVCSTIGQDERILDMFAGVGPFSIQAARRATRGRVVSLDINPYAVSYLKENAVANSVRNIEAHLMDAAEYTGSGFDRILMNLPSGSAAFLAHATELLSASGTIEFYELIDEGSAAARADEFGVHGLTADSVRKVKSYSPVQGIYHFSLRRTTSGQALT